MIKRNLGFILYLIILIPPNLASAASDNFKLNGFLTVSATKADFPGDTSYSNKLASNDLSFSTRDTRFGLQITGKINQKTELLSQFLAKGGIEDFDSKLDWAFIKYKPTDTFRIHAGKFKIPQALLSDYVAVGHGYPWVRPPEEVYAINPLTSLSGINFIYNKPLGSMKLLFQIYSGNGSHTVLLPGRTIEGINQSTGQTIAKGTPFSLVTSTLSGTSIDLRFPALTFHLAYFKTKIDVPPLIKDEKGNVSNAGITLDWEDIVIYSEYVIRNADTITVSALPDQIAWYATLGYRIGKFLPYTTFSKIREGKDKHPLAIKQKSLAVGFRYELESNTALKFEATRVRPEAGNHGLIDEAVTEGKFYTMTMDIIF